MEKPTEKEIEKEIAELKTIAPKLKESYFGDDNKGGCLAQVTVLEKRMTEQEIYDRWEDEKDMNASRYIIDSAFEAYEWMMGKSIDGKPSENWMPLVK